MIKRGLLLVSFLGGMLFSAASQEVTKSKGIVKKGYNFGPFPVLGFDADKGFGFGGLLNIFDFGDGSTYPNPRQQWYMEASYYTKGTQIYVISYDSRHLIPGVRMSLAGQVTFDNALNFYGFNGYESFYDYKQVDAGKDEDDARIFSPYYRVERLVAYLKADFTGDITDNGRLRWVAGYHLKKDRYSDVDIAKLNKGIDEHKHYDEEGPTLFGQYKTWGIIPANQKNGGLTSALRAGLIYDSRDVENNPGRGIWAEGHVIAAPKFLGSSVPYYRYSLAFRQYVPLIYRKLTFAYRLNYQGTMGNSLPFYAMPYMSVMGKGYDRDAVGGYHTVRGMLRNRVQGMDVAFCNAEFRWRFSEFNLLNQNVAFALNAFTDGALVTRGYAMSFRAKPSDFGSVAEYEKSKAEYEAYMASGKRRDGFHQTVGAGLRFIMNENFILAGEYGIPLNKQDGNASFYLNVGYLF